MSRKKAKYDITLKIFAQNEVFSKNMSRAPEDSETEEATAEARRSNRMVFQEIHKKEQHLPAKNQDRANRMVGSQTYHRTLASVRRKGGDSDGSRINSRKWVVGEFGSAMWENGEDWKSISAIQWRMGLRDSFLKHAIVGPYGVFGILM